MAEDMAETRIGGHQGMDVLRVDYSGVASHIRKRAIHAPDDANGLYSGVPHADLYEHNKKALANEYAMLLLVEDTGAAPTPFVRGDDYIDQEDLGDSNWPKDMEAFRRNMCKLLARIRSKNVRHGDLTYPNLIINEDQIKAVDWQEAHVIGEPAPQKSPYTDSYLLLRTIYGMGPIGGGTPDTPRVARRWAYVLQALGGVHNLTMPLQGKKFMDLGCFQGDFPAWAAAEGMVAYGLDQGGFRTGENSIEIGKEIWGGHPYGVPFGSLNLRQGSIMGQERFEYDVVMMFSTWSYIVEDYDRGDAERLLWRIMLDCGILFFENQLHGDGPGPSFLETDKDVERLLTEYGKVTHLVRIDVTGRPGKRSVWMVEPR